MHKERARIFNCVVYWDGRYLCVHHPKEAAHHVARTYEEAFAIAKELQDKYPDDEPELESAE